MNKLIYRYVRYMLIISIILTIAEILTNKYTKKSLKKANIDTKSKIILFLLLHYLVYFVLYFTIIFITVYQNQISKKVYLIYAFILISVLIQWKLLDGKCILTEISNEQIEIENEDMGFRDPYNIITGTYPNVNDKIRNTIYYGFLYSVSAYSIFKFFY